MEVLVVGACRNDCTIAAKPETGHHVAIKVGQEKREKREVMAMNQAKIAEMERALEEARSQLWQEDGRRYQVIMREISDTEKERILGRLTDRSERILFGLEAADEPKARGQIRPGGAGGDLKCSICGKSGLTKRGLGLHMTRMHKEETVEEE